MSSGVHIRRKGTTLSRRLLLSAAGLLASGFHEIASAQRAAPPLSAPIEKMPAADEVGTQTLRLAEWAAQLRYDDIPPAVLARAKLLVLDGIGCTIYGCRREAGAALARYVRESGDSSAEATLWGLGRRASLRSALLVNSTSAHASNMGDTHSETIIHTNYLTPQSAISVGEMEGSSGRDLLVAIIAGNEASIRAGLAAHIGKEGGYFSSEGRGWHATGSFGGIAAAVTAARLMHLPSEAMVQAIVLAGAQGFAAYRPCGAHMGKHAYAGRAVANGVEAACLARAGFISGYRLFEDGLCYGSGLLSPIYDVSAASADLGQRWETMNVDFAIYPAKKTAYPNIDALLSLRQEYGLKPANVSKIVAHTFYEPPRNVRPRDATEALNSLQFNLAAALFFGRFSVAELERACLEDPQVLAFADERIEVVRNPELERMRRNGQWPGAVEVLLEDGRRITKLVEYHRGQVQNFVREDEVEAKFLGMAQPVIGQKAERVVDVVRNLDNIDRASELTVLLAPS
jgi:2-methylcitrate dehydratase PrpD